MNATDPASATDDDRDPGARLRLLGTTISELAALGVPVPTHIHWEAFYRTPTLSWLLFGPVVGTDEAADGQREVAQKVMRTIGGTWDKQESGDLYTLSSARGGVNLEIMVDRRAVCERVVTNVRTVTRIEPARPAQVVREQVEDVEWRCGPILDGDADQARRTSQVTPR